MTNDREQFPSHIKETSEESQEREAEFLKNSEDYKDVGEIWCGKSNFEFIEYARIQFQVTQKPPFEFLQRHLKFLYDLIFSYIVLLYYT